MMNYTTTQLSSPTSLMKFLVRHDWTKLNIKKSIKRQQGEFASYKNDSELATSYVLSYVCVWQKNESLSVRRIVLKKLFFDLYVSVYFYTEVVC